VLFQEVPGCLTCRNYGREVLSHPLIVEAIETLFVPAAIYNNKSGKDAAVLRYYGEPSWNNPVVRIVGAGGQDIAPRLSGDFSRLGVVRNMIYALQRSDRDVPAYLGLLKEELEAEAGGTETAHLAMYCFWTGEKELGKLKGIVATEPGYMHGREVVKVQYNPKEIKLSELAEAGRRVQCADQVFVDDPKQQSQAAAVVGQGRVKPSANYRKDKDDKYYLSRTHFRFVPMTPLQATRANSLIGRGMSPEAVLSPRQVALAREVRANPAKGWKSLIGKGIEPWWEITNSR
jgi:hypothetical protein